MLPLYLPDRRRSPAQAAHQARVSRPNPTTRRSVVSMWQKYGKSITAALLAAATAVVAGITQEHVNPAEWIRIAIAVVTALTVYLAPVTTDYRWIKTVLAVVLAALNVLVALILDGLQPSDWMAVLLAAATALGVGVAPAVSDTHPPTPAEP